ncbi:MAG: domain containing protein [Deltaproteobacteria bacterium]|nr:domain containing protein [Deltaproteobacteria bacterium]
MSDTEPALLRTEAPGATATGPTATGRDASPGSDAPRSPKASASEPPVRPSRRDAPVVHVVGFWKRAIAAVLDLSIVIPTALVLTWIVSKISGVHLPSNHLHLLDVDLWIDLVLAADPALVMAIVMFTAIGLVYLFVLHIVLGRTLGMRLLKLRVIDVYGERPSPARCAARCAGYLAGVATLFLGFLWMGFDSEKRGLQDWIAGTYVVRA